jgi:NADH:ubiquinone oxidoreductase subunit 3 (subunit A)
MLSEAWQEGKQTNYKINHIICTCIFKIEKVSLFPWVTFFSELSLFAYSSEGMFFFRKILAGMQNIVVMELSFFFGGDFL